MFCVCSQLLVPGLVHPHLKKCGSLTVTAVKGPGLASQVLRKLLFVQYSVAVTCVVKRPEISSKVHLKTLLCFQYLGAVISRCSGLYSCCGKRAQACESGSSNVAVCPVLRCSGLRNC